MRETIPTLSTSQSLMWGAFNVVATLMKGMELMMVWNVKMTNNLRKI